MSQESYSKDRRKQKFHYKEDRDDFKRGLSDMVELLQQAVWLLAIMAIMMMAVVVGGVAIIMLSS